MLAAYYGHTRECFADCERYFALGNVGSAASVCRSLWAVPPPRTLCYAPTAVRKLLLTRDSILSVPIPAGPERAWW